MVDPDTLSEDRWKKLVELHGGKFYEYVTKSVTHLVTNPKAKKESSGKIFTAIQKGVLILSEDWLYACLQSGTKADERPHILKL